MRNRDTSLAAIDVAVFNVGGALNAINIFREKLASASGQHITRDRVYHWMRVTKKPTPELCQAIEAISGVTKEELRPDVFGDPVKQSYVLPPLPDHSTNQSAQA